LCNDLIIPPPIIGSLETDVENTLKETLPNTMSIAGRQVFMDTDNLEVKAELFDGKLVMSLDLRATVDGVPLPKPFVIEVETNMGRIINFAEDFAETQKDHRMLDSNLIKLLRRSNPVDECWLPTTGTVPSGGFRKDWTTLRNCMEDLIYHTLASTYEWQRPDLLDHCPEGVASCISDGMLKKAFIPQIMKYDEGTWGQYVDLELEFEFATQGRRLNRADPEMTFNTTPDPVRFSSHGIPIIPPLTSYEVNYDVSFPVVIRVWDEPLETYFYFAVFVNIDDTEPSDTCNLGTIGDDPYTRICINEAVHPAKITTLDPEGNGLPSVYVSLGICELGVTSDGGLLQRNVPDVDGVALELFYPFANTWHSECVDTADLADKVVSMTVPKEFDTHFYVIEIKKDLPPGGGDGMGGTEGILKIIDFRQTTLNEIDVVITRTGDACMDDIEYIYNNYFRVTDTGLPVSGTFTDGSLELPATALYNWEISLDGSTIESNKIIDYTKDDIYIFAPLVTGGSVTDSMIEELYGLCMIEPVSHEGPMATWVGCPEVVPE
jgi:hypothetical protein